MRDKDWLILRKSCQTQHYELCFQCDLQWLGNMSDPFRFLLLHLCRRWKKFCKVEVSNMHSLLDKIDISFILNATLGQHRLEQNLHWAIFHFWGTCFLSNRILSYLILQELTSGELFLRVIVRFLLQRRFLQDNQGLLKQMVKGVFHNCAFQKQIVSSVQSILQIFLNLLVSSSWFKTQRWLSFQLPIVLKLS